jgi:hypothetical protein
MEETRPNKIINLQENEFCIGVIVDHINIGMNLWKDSEHGGPKDDLDVMVSYN